MDPLSDLENAKAQHDVGTIAFRMYCGARAEGASRREAFLVMLAWFQSMASEAAAAAHAEAEEEAVDDEEDD